MSIVLQDIEKPTPENYLEAVRLVLRLRLFCFLVFALLDTGDIFASSFLL
jgi:hypothetical protein